MPTLQVTLPKLASHIDHSLLHPTMTDAEIISGLELSKRYGVGAACVKPYSIPDAVRILAGSPALVCAVIGFPHGNSTTDVKVYETIKAAQAGAVEIDMVVNVGKVLSGEWAYVEAEIDAINQAAVTNDAILKVIFENDFLKDEHIITLCQICARVGVAYVKTSTGYGFVKTPDGKYTYKGATVPHLQLMKKTVGEGVKVKAAGGIRTLDEFLYVLSLGVERVGLSATEAILEEARKRGIGESEVEVVVQEINTAGGTY